MIFFAGLGYAGWTLAWKATHTPTGDIHFEGTGTAWNPPTPALLKIIILICVVLMFVQSAIHLEGHPPRRIARGRVTWASTHSASRTARYCSSG